MGSEQIVLHGCLHAGYRGTELAENLALALLQGRDHVIPEDVRHLAHRVLRHRVLLTYEATADDMRVETIIDAIVRGVRTP